VTGEAGSPGGPVRPLVALGLATVTFIALLIFGLGMISLALSADIVEVPGLGQLPGILATALTTAAFALALWLAMRRAQPSYWGALWTAVACYAVYVVTMWIGVLVSSEEVAVASSVAGRIATTWFGAVVAIAGSALLFGLVHVPAYGLAALPVDVGAGLLFGWQRWASGTWTVPAATHAFANALVVLR
jgi:hypothetical protein